jgi:hypothetical protein
MAGVSAKFKSSFGSASDQTTSAMYPGTAAAKAGPEVITGELLALVIVELLVLGVIRFKFSKHFGG